MERSGGRTGLWGKTLDVGAAVEIFLCQGNRKKKEKLDIPSFLE
jgi:hypothetical protein